MWNNQNVIKILTEGGVAVMPTDTIYGIVGQAFTVPTVNRIYSLRKRSPEKPCIILIGDMSELEKFSIVLNGIQKDVVSTHWTLDAGIEGSRPTSIIFDCDNADFAYLHRGTRTLAFRLPQNKQLRELLLKTGPLIAPSANPQGLPTATTIDEAKKYFGDSVDLYVDGGEIRGQASILMQLYKDGTMSIIRG